MPPFPPSRADASNRSTSAVAPAQTQRDARFVVLIPIRDDWESARLLLDALDDALGGAGLTAEVLMVDDGSEQPWTTWDWPTCYNHLERVEVLPLRRNLGHQRAIALGLAYLEAERDRPAVVVMDGDGEDNPRDVPMLWRRCVDEGMTKIVFAGRARRSESRVFQVGYRTYQVLHRVLTGIPVRFGNFSVIPPVRLASLTTVTELWNHYAAAAVRSRQPHVVVPTHRAKRLKGQSRMNFPALVIHGLSAVSVFSEIVGVRLLILASLLLGALSGAALGLGVYVWWTGQVVPKSWIVGIGLILGLPAFLALLALGFCVLVLASRSSAGFLPCRDYHFFFDPPQPVAPRLTTALPAESASIPSSRRAS
ncbi:glycosyl transferase family protein [Isosphaera pallida ATCC 43644]|uniref:Glycosyl transferase family protein n=1 Tax=Isosphaera pallida (strain ATCC 43644 / DSM 9630 / IS1B) TaxID=575540 RepID=E8R6A4_ISOPI|nr:glycosyltransferase [Isosphaera pallida]ADV61805.1 glycosyl transferase family protein [Isosphaera pallida ATCC 43644]